MLKQDNKMRFFQNMLYIRKIRIAESREVRSSTRIAQAYGQRTGGY